MGNVHDSKWMGVVVCAALLIATGWFLFASSQEPTHPNAKDTFAASSHGETAQSETAGLGPPGGKGPSLDRQEISQSIVLQFPDVREGTPTGVVRLVHFTSELEQRLSHDTFVGDSLLGNSVILSQPLVGSEVVFSLPLQGESMNLVALVEVPGFSPIAVPIQLPTTRVWLEKVKTITVVVTDTAGHPVQGAACWFMTAGLEMGSHDLPAKLGQYGFQSYGVTDEHGEVQFYSPRPGEDNQVQVVPPGNLATQGAMDIKPGQTVSVVCGFGFSVKGVVTSLATGNPLPGATVLAVGRLKDDLQSLGTATADAEGFFRFEGLPLNYPSVFLEAEANGFAFQRMDLLPPRANGLKEVQFRLASAVPAEFRVETPWGEPIANCTLSIREERNGWTLEDIRSDENGRVAVSKRLRSDRSYQVVFKIGDWVAIGAELLIPGVTEVLTVSRVARVDSLEIHGLPTGFDPHSILWQPSSPVRPGEQAWRVDSPSPLIPSGPGYWILESTEGDRLGKVGAIAPGLLESMQLDFHATKLSFELPDGGPFALRIEGIDGEHLVRKEGVESGRHTFAVVPGVYGLQVQAEEVERDWPSLIVPKEGRDLGLIDGFEYCGIEGLVTDSSGKPMPFLGVSAYGRVPFGDRHGLTDVGGNFHLSGMAPGSYMLVIHGGDAYGPLVVEKCIPILLRPGQWLGPLEIQAAIPEEDADLTVSWKGNPVEGATAWVVNDDASMIRVLSPGGTARFPAAESDGHAYGVAFSPGILFLNAASYSVADVEVPLLPAQTTNTLRFVDESGEPRNDVSFHIEDFGKPFTFIGRPREDGTLEIAASLGLGVQVRVRQLGGRAYMYSLDQFLTESEIIVPRKEEHHQVFVTDLRGQPLSSAVALKFQIGEFHHADGFGVLSIPLESREAFFVEAPGYLGRWWSDPNTDSIALPMLLFDSVFSPSPSTMEGLSATPVHVRFSPLALGDSFAFQEYLELPWPKDSSLPLPPLPEGKLRIELLGTEGEVHWSGEYQLKEHDQILD